MSKSDKKIQAVILAGGQGSRLRPYTTVLPKPLMPLGDLPIIEIVIRQLKFYGFRRIAVSVGYLAGFIESYLGDGRRWGINIEYIRERKPLGTAGAVKYLKNLKDNFLVVNGDILTDIHFNELIKFHEKEKSMATISIIQRTVKTDFGVIEVNSHNELINYIEKPAHKSYVSMGVTVLHKKATDYIKNHEKITMPELILRMRDQKQKVTCFKSRGRWLDLGRIEDLEEAQEIWRKHKRRFLKQAS